MKLTKEYMRGKVFDLQNELGPGYGVLILFLTDNQEEEGPAQLTGTLAIEDAIEAMRAFLKAYDKGVTVQDYGNEC